MPLRPDLPFAPRALPFFYGWWIVVVGALGILMSIPGQTMGVSVFTDPLLEATGLSRLALSNAYLIGTLASGLLLPVGGALLDRLGARTLAFASCLGLAATLLALSRIDQLALGLASLLGLEASVAIAGGVLAVAFACLRFSGQGLLTLSSRAMVAKWFERRRGLVSGVVGAAVNFGFSFAPALLLAWITAAGWRGAWVGMAASVGLGMAAVVLVFFRDNPEECGLEMDGRPASDARVHAAGADPEPSYTRAQALRALPFWYVTAVLAVQSMVFTGVTFHIVDIGLEGGLDRANIVGIFIPIAVLSTATGLAAGVAADRVAMRWLVLAMALCQLTGFLGMARVGDLSWRLVAILGWGLSQGFFGPLTAVAVPKLFGRMHLGAIAGVQMSALVIASALGPAALAVSKSFLGSYRLGLLSCCALSAASFVLAAAARRSADPGRRAAA